MIGRQIGHFQIRARLGHGGMGEVYLADDLSLRRKVALKLVLGVAAGDASAGRRLQQEAYAVAALDHPFICKVFEAGERDGERYIAMEYVEGQTLKDRLAAGPFPASEAGRLALEIADALEYAHARGVIHRDLKPSNVMVSADGHARVMDFGIAKRLMPEGGDLTTQSAWAGSNAGELTGTLAYMSPEQVRGEAVDARSDIFAFGVVLYEMLSRAHPFLRDSAFATADAIVREPAAPLADRAPGVPPALSQIVSRCLEKDRERRFGSFKEVRAALSVVTATTGVTASVPAAPTRAGRRTAVAVGALAVIAVLAVLWLRPEWLPFSKPALAFGERDWILIADFENLTGDKVFDRSLGAALDVGIAQSRYVNVFPRDRLQAALQRARKPRDAPLDEALAAEVAVREGVRAVLACSIAQVGNVYSLTARVLDPRTQATIVRESVEASGRERVLEALNELAARVRRALGESIGALSEQGVALPLATTASLDALKMYADALRLGVGEEATGEELLRQAIAADPDFAIAHASLGYRHFLSSDRERRTEGERLIARALDLSNRLTSRERLWIQAAADDARGNRQQAVIGYKSYLAQYPDDTRAWFRLGWTHMAALGQFNEGAAAFKRVTDIDPNNSSAWVNLASCYSGLRQYDQAVATYDRTFASVPEFMIGQFINLEYGSALVQVGRVEDARAAFEKMTNAPDVLRRARGRRSMAFLLMHLGQYGAAAAELRQAIQINEANKFNLSAFRDHFILAQVLLAAGAKDEAARELLAVDRLMAQLSLGPEWLSGVVKMRARLGQMSDAERVAALIASAVGNAVADTSINRNVGADQGHLDLARGEIELARGRGEQAATLFAAAAARLVPIDVLESQAAALLAAGRPEEAAFRYEELLALAPFGMEEQEDGVRAFVALGGIYEKLGRVDAARALYERLIAQWSNGDDNLVLLKQARARLKTIK